ncbi:hypothetical protein MSAN_01918800 [Mycena sanguinolenta]|uniref:Uncharacterized protein n=1 Tax=Mycena sanguinolenta TaxID=230812 RepID=A0A8H6XN75_9AGAR|nr:hypothetical protein MSAN_01918800 [Mycena sanguinolenta]
MPRHPPLDPGVPPRKRSSFCRFCLCTCPVLFGFFVAVILYGVAKALFQMTQFSHSRVFQNQTLDEVEDRAAVVRPLVDGKQSFDIAVSVWAPSADIDDGESGVDVSETPLFSDIVFRGLHLVDKHISMNVTYQLPISIFQRNILEENDLRASFVLIPTVPSLVNQITNFSTWRPEILKTPPVRSWPFPLGAADNGPQSIADRALDSFGFSMPLLEFHEFGSKCTKSEPILETNSTDEEALSDGNDEDDEEYYEEQEQVQKDTTGEPPGVSDISKYPEHALKRHPFVVTRTQIRVVDETHIFNRKLYNKEHNKLRATSCGQGKDKQPELNLCHRTYKANGNWETRLQLQVPDKETGEPGTEWAYAPYISHAAFSAGPQDLVPVPVNRENCTQFENTSSTDPEFITIHWRLSYSGRSPAKYAGAELITAPKRVAYNESDYKKAMAHSSAEIQNGLIGHRFYEDAHPRRRFLIGGLLGILSPFPSLLSMSYWYTRTSTVSISVSGTTFLALDEILSAFADLANAAETSKLEFSSSEWLKWSAMILWTVAFELSLPFFMMRTVTRLTFSRDASQWIPTVRQISPTHMERTSQRLDSRTSWRIKVGVCVTLIVANYVSIKYYSFVPLGYYIVAPLHPPLGPDDQTTVSNPFAWAYAAASAPLALTGLLSQILLNQRSKTFAGRYKVAVVVGCIEAILRMVNFLPFVIGRFDVRPGLSVAQVIEYTLRATMAWQAVVFPSVTEKTEEEDSQ